MRITYVGYGDFHRYAGMKQLYHFAQEVCRNGHEAQILSAGSADTVRSMAEPPRAEIIEMAFTGPLLTRHVRRRVQDFKPDILHVWTPRHVPALAGWQLQRWTKARLILDHEDDEIYIARNYVGSHGRRFRGVMRLVARPLARLKGQSLPWLAPLMPDGSVRRMAQDRMAAALLRSRVSAHTAISPALEIRVRKTWPQAPVYLLYPGTDLQLFHPERSGALIRQRHNLGDRPLLVYSGTMNLEIFQYFTEVIQRLVATVPDIFLLLVGNDGFRHNAELLLGELGLRRHIYLTGIVPHPEVPMYLAAADVLVQHPIDIGNELRLPAKLPEYLAMGKPLVTYSQGIGEILEHGVHALKVATSDPDEMSRCLATLLGNRSLCADMGQAARNLAEQLFDWRANSQRLLNIYFDVSER